MLGLLVVILAGSVFALPGTESLHAQQGAMTCPALVDLALERVDNSCSGLDRNSACYGFNNVEASFAREVDPGFFTQPSDRGALTLFERIETAPLDLALEQWGVAVLSAQANLPNTLPGQAVTFLLIGDVTLENEVDEDNAFVPIDPINVITNAAADVHIAPDDSADIIDTLTAGMVLDVDAQSGDGNWLRAIFEDRVGWLQTSAVSPSPLLDDLPMLTSESRSSLQAFSVQTGVRGLQCSEAPSALAIQSPEGIQIDLTVNGADIRIGSTIIMQSISDTEFVIIVVEGHVEIDGVIIEAGQAINAMLDEDGNIISFGEPRPATEEELQIGDLVSLMLSRILDDDGGDDGSSSGQGGDNANGMQCGPNATHTVVAGDTLFAISRRYGTTVEALVAANNIINGNIIVVGQVLNVPCSMGNELPITIINNPPQVGDSPPQIDCTGFRATSPTDGFPFGPVTFFWDPPAAGDFNGFRINVYNERGELVGMFETGDPNATNVIGNMSTIGGGFSFAWEVVALAGGVPVCVSDRISLFRESPPEQGPPPQEEKPKPICGNGKCEAGEDAEYCYVDCGNFA